MAPKENSVANQIELDDGSRDLSRIEQGRHAQKSGKNFEDLVVEAYRLLRYRVEHSRLFDGRQIDLFLTGQFGDLTVHRAIECKASRVTTDEIDSFVAKLRLVRREFPAVHGTIVSGVGFTDAVKSHALAEGIQLTLYRDLAAQLFDGHTYATQLIKDCENSERYPMSLFVEPTAGYEIAGESLPAFELFEKWLTDPEWQQLTLLGDVGTGKTFLSRVLAYRLASKFMEEPYVNAVPVRIDLRNADREFTLEGLVLSHFAKIGMPQIAFDVFQHVLSNGHIILILDGFDEMAARVTPQVTRRNFFELARSVHGRAKVLLTCRTHYFTSKSEEEEVILGTSGDYGTERARDLYWDLINRKGFRIAYLRPFESSQIEEYITRARPNDAAHILHKIRQIYNLLELSHRPMLLDMIVKSVDKLQTNMVGSATLYQVFTDAWVHRDSWRQVLSPEAKLTLVTALSRSLWESDSAVIHHTKLSEYLQSELAVEIQDPKRFVEIDNEVRTASFLIRDDAGHFGFAHKSYSEFFLARYLAAELNQGRVECLRIRRLTPEVVSFLAQLIEKTRVEPSLEQVLTDSYLPLLSENALLCLYGFRRDSVLKQKDASQPQVQLPSGVKLDGALLDQISLDGAVMLHAGLDRAHLSESTCVNADFSDSSLDSAILDKANLTGCKLRTASMVGVTLKGTLLENAILVDANLENANMDEAMLVAARTDGANLRGVTVRGALLPQGFWPSGQRRDIEQLTGSLDSESPPADYVSLLREIYPDLKKTAKQLARYYDVDPDEFVSEIAIYLANPRNMEVLKALRGEDRSSHLRVVMKSMLRQGGIDTARFYPIEAFSEEELDVIMRRTIGQQRNPEDELVLKELVSRLETALSDCPADLVSLLLRKIVDGESVEKMAEQTGKSITTIYRRIAKAREILLERTREKEREY